MVLKMFDVARLRRRNSHCSGRLNMSCQCSFFAVLAMLLNFASEETNRTWKTLSMKSCQTCPPRYLT